MSPRISYSEEFKRDAVALARATDQSVAQTARDLGIAQATLHRWVTQAKIDDGEREGLTTDERKRLTELERENRILREERGNSITMAERFELDDWRFVGFISIHDFNVSAVNESRVRNTSRP